MKRSFITNIIRQVACWILVLQLVNISINPPDIKYGQHRQLTNKEDLSVNDIESVYELIAEELFDQDIPESNEEEIDTTAHSFDLYFLSNNAVKLPALVFPIKHVSHYHYSVPSVHPDPQSPPPKAAQS